MIIQVAARCPAPGRGQTMIIQSLVPPQATFARVTTRRSRSS